MEHQLFYSFIIVIAIILCIVYYHSIKKRQERFIRLEDVWIGEKIPEINRLSTSLIYMLSDAVINQKYNYRELIDCCKKKYRFMFFRCIDSKEDSVFHDSVIVTEELNYTDLEPGDYIVILINGNCYLRRIYKIDLDDETIYYKSTDSEEIRSVLLSRVISKVNFMFNKELLKQVL